MLLELDGLSGGYGNVEVLHDVSLAVAPGEVVAVIGANGAGKTTMLRAVSGAARTWSGTIEFDGRTLRRETPEARAALGIAHVPEGRGILASLTVEENLRLGLVSRGRLARAAEQDAWDLVFNTFPELRNRLDVSAAALSGGQQQMLAVARGLLASPKLMMVDELSFGLAPILVEALLDAVSELRDTGTAFLLVEQSAQVLRISDRAYVLRGGRTVLEGRPSELQASGELIRSYMGENGHTATGSELDGTKESTQ